MEDIEIFGYLFTVSPIRTTVLNTYDTVIFFYYYDKGNTTEVISTQQDFKQKVNSEILSIKKPYMYN